MNKARFMMSVYYSSIADYGKQDKSRIMQDFFLISGKTEKMKLVQKRTTRLKV